MAVRGDEGGRLSRALGASRSVHLTSVCTCEELRPGPTRAERRRMPLCCGGRTPHPHLSALLGVSLCTPGFHKWGQPGEALSFPRTVRRDGGALDSRPPHRRMT